MKQNRTTQVYKLFVCGMLIIN